MTSEPTTPEPISAADLVTALPSNVSENAKKMAELLSRLISDVARNTSRTDYSLRQNLGLIEEINDTLQFQDACLRGLFDHLHLPYPTRRPKILDAVVELFEGEDPEAESLDLSVIKTTAVHPVYGHYQAVLRSQDAPPEVRAFNNLDSIVAQRLTEALEKVPADKFYFAKLSIVHARPINEESVPVPVLAPTEENANEQSGSERPA